MLRPESGLYFPSGSCAQTGALKHYKLRERPPNGICYVAIEMGIAGSGLTEWQEAGEERIQWCVCSAGIPGCLDLK